MDNEKLTSPLYAMLRKHGIKNICVHKGFLGSFLEPGCQPADMTRAAADWLDLNFIAFHSAYAFEAELAEQAKQAKVKNIYAEIGLLTGVMRSNPQRFAQCLGTQLDGLGADHILWGTDTPVIGPPHWQVQGFQTFTMPDEMIEKNKYQQLTPEVKRQSFGGNVARLFNLDIKKAKQAVEGELLYKRRNDAQTLKGNDTMKPRIPRFTIIHEVTVVVCWRSYGMP